MFKHHLFTSSPGRFSYEEKGKSLSYIDVVKPCIVELFTGLNS